MYEGHSKFRDSYRRALSSLLCMKDKDAVTKEKYETINRLLQEEYVVVHVDGALSGVVLPPHLAKSHSVTLKLSRFFRGGIEIFGDKIVTNLLFDNEYFECSLPFEAIWGVTSVKGSNIVWPESAPQEILKKITETASAQAEAAQTTEQPETKSKRGSHLRRVK